MTQNASIRLGDLFITLGGLLVLGFSFAPFVQYAGEIRESMPAGTSGRFSAWSTETFMVPLTTFVIVAAVLAVASVWVRFGLRRNVDLVGFRLTQLEVGLTLFVFVVLLGMTMSDKYLLFGAGQDEELRGLAAGTFGHLEVGWGAVLMVIGALIALAGALLNHLGVGPALAVKRSGEDTPPPTDPAQAG